MKFLVVIFIVTISSNVQAQTFGVKGGLNLANMLVKDNDETYSDDFKSIAGFHVGVTADFPLTDLLSFEPNVLISSKGLKLEESADQFSLKNTMNLTYLDIPLHLKATFGSENQSFFVLAGPYLGYGLSGKFKHEITFGNESEKGEEDITWGDGEDDLKRLDYGLSVGAGVGYNNFTVGASYDLGLANISNDSDDGFKTNHRVFRISLGYRF